MKIKGIVFDMDGTMFDTERVSIKAMNAANEKYNIILYDEIYTSFMGLPGAEIRRRYLEMFGEDFDYEGYRQFKIDYMNNDAKTNGVPIKKGLIELLEYAKENNISCAVATSTDRWRVDMLIELAGLAPFFKAVVCGTDVKNGKPNPDIFQLAAEKIGLKPEDCVGVEDSRNGIVAVSKSGMYAFLVPDMVPVDDEMEEAADRIGESLFDVLAFIKE